MATINKQEEIIMCQITADKKLMRMREYGKLSDTSRAILFELSIMGGDVLINDYLVESDRSDESILKPLVDSGLIAISEGSIQIVWDCIKIDNSRDRVRLHRAKKAAELTGEEVTLSEGKTQINYDSIVNAYHRILPDNPRVLIMNDKRRSNAKARYNQLKETTANKTHAEVIAKFEWYFTLVSQCPFLCGKISGNRNKPFMADFEWLMNSTNFVKVVEGRYKP